MVTSYITGVPDELSSADAWAVRYCLPSTLPNPAGGGIARLQVMDASSTSLLDLASSSASGFEDHTRTPGPHVSAPPEVRLGQSYTLRLNGSGSISGAVGVWADFNGDGGFSDANESLSSGGAGFTVPNDAPTGVVRFRVVRRTSAESEALAPCAAFVNGEIEDFYLNVRGTEDSTSNAAPYCKPAVSSNPGIFIKSVELKSFTSNIQGETVTRVDRDVFRLSTSSSGTEEYKHHTNTASTFVMRKAQGYILNITPSREPTSVEGVYHSVFLDLDQDGAFSSPRERLVVYPGKRKGDGYRITTELPFSIPRNAKAGKTRLRVMLAYTPTRDDIGYTPANDWKSPAKFKVPEPCNGSVTLSTDHNPLNGEVEDYTVAIQDVQANSDYLQDLGGALPLFMGTQVFNHDGQGNPPQYLRPGSTGDIPMRYRQPAVATTNNGVLVAIVDARWEKGSDVPSGLSVLGRRSLDNGKTWGRQFVAATHGDDQRAVPRKYQGVGDASTLVDRVNNVVYAVYHGGRGIWSGTRLKKFYVKSEDEGQTWSTPVDISGDVYKTGWANMWSTAGPAGIHLRDGTLVVPVPMYMSPRRNAVALLYSKDYGATWLSGDPLIVQGTKRYQGRTDTGGSGISEPMVVELDDGRLLMVGRNGGSSGVRYRIVAFLDGLGSSTWTEPYLEGELPQGRGNQGTTMLYTSQLDGHDRTRILHCSNTNSPASRARRELKIYLSYDGGSSWPVSKVADGANIQSCSLNKLRDGSIGLLYEYDGSILMKSMRWMRFSLAQLTDGKDAYQAPYRYRDQTQLCGKSFGGGEAIAIDNSSPADGSRDFKAALIEGKQTGSIAGWFKTSNAGAQTILTLFNPSGAANDSMTVSVGPSTTAYNNESFSFQLVRGGAKELSMHVRRGEQHYADGKWHHFAVVAGFGSNNTIHIDGVDQSTGGHLAFEAGSASSQEFSGIDGSAFEFHIGGAGPASSPADGFQGDLGDLSLWYRGLLPPEVVALRQGKVESHHGLMAYWRLDNDDSWKNDRLGNLRGTVTPAGNSLDDAPCLSYSEAMSNRGVLIAGRSVSMAENGGRATYTVALAGAPTANVTVTPASGDTTVATVPSTPLTFTMTNWNTAQAVTVTGVNDNIDNAEHRTTVIAHTVSSVGDSDYNSVTAPSVVVTVTDDDVATLTLSAVPSSLAEAADATGVMVTATLADAVLDADLVLPLTLGGAAQAGVDYTVSGAAPTITIAARDSSATASLTITPVDDAVAEGTEMIAIGVAHARFGTAAPAQVMLTDNDTAAGLALSVDPATLVEGAGAKSVEVTAALTNGATAAETLVLRLRLAGTAERGDDYAVTGAKSITIAKGAPSGSTTLTVTPVSDGVDEGLGEVIEIGTVHNNAKVAATLFLADDDDGPPALSIRMAAGYSGRDPIPVWFVFPEPVTGFDANDVAVKGFNANGVAVTGGTLGRLSTKDGGRTYKSKVTLADPLPDSITVEVARDAAVDLSDNLGPAAVVPATANRRSLVIELSVEGWTSYTVKLNSAPTGDVTVAVASEDTGVATVLPPSLTFTASDWGTAQTVTVTGVVGSDNGVGQIREVTITHTVSGADYDGIVARLTLGVVDKIDYDADDDGLIEVRTLEQLNAVRWDLNGDGDADSPNNAAAYAAAFPHPAADPGGGSGALGCSNGGSASACTGYELKTDLDFDKDDSYADSVSNKAGWTSSTGWAPIGDNSGQFAATFDGNGYSIANLFINRSDERVGLFGHANSSARLRKLGLKDVDVTGTQRVGALAGRLEGRVERCYASGTVTGTATGKVGGLVGDNENGSVSASYAAVAVTGIGSNIGGLVGRNKGSVVLSFAAGAVNGNNNVGGLVGNQIGSTLKAVYAAGAVVGSGDNVGGLAGNNKGAITAGYATGVVSGTNDVGGLVGKNAGGSAATVSYWDTETSSRGGSAQGVGKSTAELQSPAGYRGIYAGWNLDLDSNAGGDDPWDFGASSQYPALKADLDGDNVATVDEFGGRLGHQAPRVVLVVSQAAVTVPENGGTADYTVALVSAPTANVRVTPASGDTAVATVSEPLMFTPDNWSTAQMVTVTGVNDDIDNAGDQRETTVSHTTASMDAGYNGFAAPSVAVTAMDEDTAMLALGVNPTTLAEDAVATEVTVTATLSGAALDAELTLPLALVGTALAGVDYEISGTLPMIAILAGDLSATARLMIDPVDDAVDEGASEMIAIGVVHAKFGETAPAQVALTDNDDAGLTLALDQTTLAETGSATEVTVTATLSRVNDSGADVELPLNFAGSAARGVDYTLSGTGSITVSSGSSSGTTRLSVTPVDDAIDEGLGEIVEVGTTHKGNKVAVALFLTDDDAGAPALSVEMAAGYSSTDPIAVRFVFPEPVTGFASDDVTVSAGGTLGTLSTTDGGRTYASEVTPDGMNRAITVTVRRDAVTDRSGSTGPAAPVVKTARYDATVPTLEIEGLPPAFHGAEPLVLVFHFSEPVEFGSDNVEVSNGQMTDFSGNGAVYKVTVTPDSGGALSVGVKRGAVADGAGNAVVFTTVTAQQADGELTLSKTLVRTPWRHLQSFSGHVLPADMAVQGAEVHYRASLPAGSPLDAGSVAYSYAFLREQGDVEFLTQDDDGDTATNRFRTDWYGENVIAVTATDSNGKTAAALDRVFVHFASRRILGGDAEDYPSVDPASNAYTVPNKGSHDVRNAKGSRGMAYLPANLDSSRVDMSSTVLTQGYYWSKEPRMLKTSKGTLLVTSHAMGATITVNGVTVYNETRPGTGIVVSRSVDHGSTWRPLLLQQQQDHVWTYTAMVEVDGKIHIYMSTGGHPALNNYIKQGLQISRRYRGIYYFESLDDGLTWSAPIRHDGASWLAGFDGTTLGLPNNLKDNRISEGAWPTMTKLHWGIPEGSSPSTNILKVPGLTLDGEVAPAGHGLLLHLYAYGSLLASIDGGVTWKMVAEWIPYYDGKTNNGVSIEIHNEPAWVVLDNEDQDIYVIFRRNVGVDGFNSGLQFKNEYVLSRSFSSTARVQVTGGPHSIDYGLRPAGMTFKAVHGQALQNVRARESHHWMSTIMSGPQRGKLLYTLPGHYGRYHVDLYVSKRAIRGKDTVTSNLFHKTRVKETAGWGQAAVEYLEADLPSPLAAGMGKDAIVLVGEAEPIHRETHQLIDLKPDGRAQDERHTTSAYVLSWDYLDALLEPKKLTALSASSAALYESGGPVEVTVTARLSTALAPDAPAFEAPLALSGTAWRGLDYSLAGTASVTILPGQSQGATVLTVTPVDNDDAEGARSLVIEAGGRTAELALVDDDRLGFEAGEGWTGRSTGVNAFAGPLTDIHEHEWTSSGGTLVKVLRSHSSYGARTGKQALALNWGGTVGQSSHVVLNPAGAGGVGELSFWMKGHAAGNSDFRFYVESSMDSATWRVAHQEAFQDNAPAAYARRAVSIRRPGDVLLRLRVEGTEGLVLDDLSLVPWASVLISESTLMVNEDGGEKSYTVVLAKQPAADVVVKLASGDDLAARVSPPELRFTTSNWDTAQAVRVTGVNDNVDNSGDQRRTAITHTVTSTDADYAGAAVSEVAVVVEDDDTATLALSVNPATLAEGASTADVTVTATLTGVLDAELELPLVLRGTAQAGVDYTVSGTAPAITIAEGNADAAARLTLTLVDDAVAEGTEMIAIGVAHTKFGVTAPAVVELTDDDDAGLTLTLSRAELAEADSATDVTVTAALLNGATEGSGDLTLPLTLGGVAARGVDYTVSGTESITITQGTSSGVTMLSIDPAGDSVDEGPGELIEVGTIHDNKQVAATLFLTDDDAGAPALSIEMAAGYSSTDPIAVRFVFSEPVTDFVANDDVTVTGGMLGTPSTTDGGRTYLSEVTPNDPIPASITVTVKQDAVTDQPGNTGPAVPVAATANQRGVAIAPRSVMVAEGGTAAYRVALTSKPADEVTVTVASGALAVAAVAPASLEFTPDDWVTEQTVRVTGVEDLDDSSGQERTAEVTHTVTSTDADYDGFSAPAVSVTVVNPIDYDADNDGLIEITKLEQLNAMRWDLNGNGAADSSGNNSTYAAAFPVPVAVAGVGDGALGCSDSQGAEAPCTGYELKADLDFNADASYADSSSNKAGWTSSDGWAPVGDNSDQFAATFDGNGHAISHLFIARSSTDSVGLFGHTHSSGALIRNVGLKAVNVTGNDRVGALAGLHNGTLRHCYATGTVAGHNDVGGLVGRNGLDNNQGSIYGSFAAVTVSGTKHLGGLVGQHHGVTVSASYAAGAVSGSGVVGGLIGYATSANANRGRIEAVYATGRVTGDVDGLVGSKWQYGGTFADGYWDTGTSGKTSSVFGPRQDRLPAADAHPLRRHLRQLEPGPGQGQFPRQSLGLRRRHAVPGAEGGPQRGRRGHGRRVRRRAGASGPAGQPGALGDGADGGGRRRHGDLHGGAGQRAGGGGGSGTGEQGQDRRDSVGVPEVHGEELEHRAAGDGDRGQRRHRQRRAPDDGDHAHGDQRGHGLRRVCGPGGGGDGDRRRHGDAGAERQSGNPGRERQRGGRDGEGHADGRGAGGRPGIAAGVARDSPGGSGLHGIRHGADAHDFGGGCGGGGESDDHSGG